MARPGSGRAGSPWQAAAAEVLQPTRPERPRGPEPEQDVASLQAQLAALLRETAPPGAAADDFDAGLDEFRPATSTSGEWSPADVSRRVDKGDARPGGAFDKHITPGGAFAGFRFDDDPVFSALKESEKDYDWLLLSERAQRSRGDRARRDRSPPREPALLFSHAREDAAPARPLTVSVGIGTDGPALEVPREEYEEMADRVEELRAELEASPADADLREELADLRSRLDDAVPVDAKLRGKRLFRAAAIAVLFFPAIPRLAVRRRRRRTRERDAARCERVVLAAFSETQAWAGRATHGCVDALARGRHVDVGAGRRPRSWAGGSRPARLSDARAYELEARAFGIVRAVTREAHVPPGLLQLVAAVAGDRFYFPGYFLWAAEAAALDFDELGASRRTLRELEDGDAARAAARAACAVVSGNAPAATRVRYVGAAFGGSGGGAAVASVSDAGFPPAPLPWPRILAAAFEKRGDDAPPLVDAARLRAVLLDLVFGKVLLPWVVLRPWLGVKRGDDANPRPSGSRRTVACENLRAAATVVYRALRRVGGPVHGRLAPPGGLREIDATAQHAMEVSSAVLAWEALRPRTGLERLWCWRRRLRFVEPRTLANTRTLDGEPPAAEAADEEEDDRPRPPTPVGPPPAADPPPDGPWALPAPPDGDVHAWMLEPMPPRARKRATFLGDDEVARLLVPEDDFVVAAPLVNQLIDEIAADMANWADKVVAAVLMARNVRVGDGPADR